MAVLFGVLGGIYLAVSFVNPYENETALPEVILQLSGSDLIRRINALTEKYSMGIKQRLAIAQALFVQQRCEKNFRKMRVNSRQKTK